MKKKSLRKILAASVAAMLMCAPMMAVNTAYAASITATDATDAKSYEAYMIFTGRESDGKLTDINWSDGFDTTVVSVLLTRLSESLVVGEDFTAPSGSTMMSAESVAEKLKTYTKDGTADNVKAVEFARIVAQVVKDYSIGATATLGGKTEEGSNSKTATVPDGYYLVVNKTTDGASLSRSILAVVGSATINGKVSAPTIDKKIGESKNEGVTANTAAIGDEIPYIINSTIPDMTGYEKYYYVITDTMDPGLTYKYTDEVANGVTIAVDEDSSGTITDGDTIIAADKYKVTLENGKLKIVFIDFLNQQKNNKGKEILTTYSAILNENAKFGTTKDTANLNKVDLVYSNNPNAKYEGIGNTNPEDPYTPPEVDRSPSTPDDNTPDTPYNPDDPSKKYTEPVGITPHKEVVTYTTKFELNKTDGTTNSPLEGVTFKLSGSAFNKVLVKGEEFIVADDADPAYYELKDGTYTTVTPNDDNSASYKNTTIKYKKEIIKKTEDLSGVATKEIVRKTDDNGKIVFEGLKPGTYTLTETYAIPGYNMIKDPIEFTITGTPSLDGGCTWSSTNDDVSFVDVVGAGNDEKTVDSFISDIKNFQGSVLPSTGGIGTTIFYVSGGVLVLGSVVLIITKKRMSLKDEK